eukprot:TRINITY_DN7539_c0_g1_i10.p1 TRINITY_DN7539_c0_g1~~TRINITY_DN7539_c0_g1_i10.p1  ORF type:complete len:188 (-),score=7.33 TRINITY_DN7539_c0_g1_i10:167-730(-)
MADRLVFASNAADIWQDTPLVQPLVDLPISGPSCTIVTNRICQLHSLPPPPINIIRRVSGFNKSWCVATVSTLYLWPSWCYRHASQTLSGFLPIAEPYLEDTGLKQQVLHSLREVGRSKGLSEHELVSAVVLEAPEAARSPSNGLLISIGKVNRRKIHEKYHEATLREMIQFDSKVVSVIRTPSNQM